VSVAYEKFDIRKLERLNDKGRFESLPPAVMWRALGNPSPSTIVDIGAGTGLFAREFAEMAPDAEIYAVDTEPTMVSWMLENFSADLLERVRPILGRETSIPLDANTADVVIMINLHHELADAPSSYAEALRVLRVGGQVLIADWAPGNEQGGPPQHVRASAQRIAEMLEEAGFESIVSHPELPRHSLLTAIKPTVVDA
jgi:ubiquinone/menaquinone biosynthesis C-methylase UbiE